MTGAMAISKENINGKILINIDTEEEGYLLVSCAGGIRTKSSIKVERENINDEKLYTISIRDLKGGHSGTEINKERGNSNKLMGRFLMDCLEETGEVKVKKFILNKMKRGRFCYSNK